jgi:phage shock protein C
MINDGRGPWGWGCANQGAREDRRAARAARRAAYEEWKASMKHAKRAWKHSKRAGGPWGFEPDMPPPNPEAPHSDPATRHPGYPQHPGKLFRVLHGLRRDTERGKVAGVCAGLARYYGINRTLVRLAAVFALFANPPLTVIGYAIATFLIPREDWQAAEPLRQADPAGRPSGASASPGPAHATDGLPPELSFAALRDKFRELEKRAGAMEREVSSPEFSLQRELRRMGEA